MHHDVTRRRPVHICLAGLAILGGEQVDFRLQPNTRIDGIMAETYPVYLSSCLRRARCVVSCPGLAVLLLQWLGPASG